MTIYVSGSSARICSNPGCTELVITRPPVKWALCRGCRAIEHLAMTQAADPVRELAAFLFDPNE